MHSTSCFNVFSCLNAFLLFKKILPLYLLTKQTLFRLKEMIKSVDSAISDTKKFIISPTSSFSTSEYNSNDKIFSEYKQKREKS